MAQASDRPPNRSAGRTGESGDDSMRIAKAMARAGLCSRRDAERWIAEGRVVLNGKVLTTPAVTVGAADRVEVDGQPLRKPEAARLWRYHKPRGRVTTHRDPEGRPTVFDAMPEDMPRVISIGRLDFNTEGLLLLTTNGALARHIELPATGWLRRYRVRAHGSVKPEALAALRDGVLIDGVHYGPVKAALDRQQGANVWLTIGLREGKNREVRKILSTLGLEVTRLIRLSFGPFALGDLEPGAVEEVQPRVMAQQMGAKMAAELGLRFATAADGGARGQTIATGGHGGGKKEPRAEAGAQGFAHGRRAAFRSGQSGGKNEAVAGAPGKSAGGDNTGLRRARPSANASAKPGAKPGARPDAKRGQRTDTRKPRP